jgi:hypothetical protein
VVCIQQEIAAAGDTAVLVYREETKPEDVTREGIAAAMKQGIKEKTTKLMIKLGKMTAVANPAQGPEFLGEVYCNLIFLLLFEVHFIWRGKLLNFNVFVDRKALEYKCFTIGADTRKTSSHSNYCCSSSSQDSMVEMVELVSAHQGGCTFSFETS